MVVARRRGCPTKTYLESDGYSTAETDGTVGGVTDGYFSGWSDCHAKKGEKGVGGGGR